MKVFHSVFVFFGVVFIITSLHHLYYYNKCCNDSIAIRANLQKHENINNDLYRRYIEANNRHTNLRKIAANKLYMERNLSNENNKHAIAMSNIIPLQYQRLLNYINSPNPKALKNSLDKLKILRNNRESQKEKEKEKETHNYIIKQMETDNDNNQDILILGNNMVDKHPYSHGADNDSIFNQYSINKCKCCSDGKCNCSCCNSSGGSGGSGNTGGIGRSGYYDHRN